MAKIGKKYADSVKLFDRSKQYDTAEALALVCQTAKAKFDETVEIHIRLGVDSRHADQQVRGAVVLPNGTGKTARVLVFAKDAKLEEAQAEHREGVESSNLFTLTPPRMNNPNTIIFVKADYWGVWVTNRIR